MFKINYRIVHSRYDDFIGQHGFFQIICNGNKYGEMYSEEIEAIMDKVSLYDWFERLARVINILNIKEYVVLSDVESYNTWIEFLKKNEEVLVSIVKAKKDQGSHDIEFILKAPQVGEWGNQVVSFKQFRKEVLEKGTEYIGKIFEDNPPNILINDLVQKFKDIK